MYISPISNQHFVVKKQNLKTAKKTNVSFQSNYFPDFYNQICTKYPDFRYKVPEKIFQLIDQMYKIESDIFKIFKSVNVWQKIELPNYRLEHIGLKDGKVKMVRRGVVPYSEMAYEDIWHDYVALYDDNTNKYLELEYSLPSRPMHGGGIKAKRNFYPNSGVVEYETLCDVKPTPWVDYQINHYSPYGIRDKTYTIKDSYIGNSTVEAKDLFTGETNNFSCLLYTKKS